MGAGQSMLNRDKVINCEKKVIIMYSSLFHDPSSHRALHHKGFTFKSDLEYSVSHINKLP